MLPRTNHFSNVFVERNDWPADRRTTSIRRVQCCRFGDKRALGVEWSSIYLHRGYQQLAATLTPCLRSLLPLPSFVVAPPKRDHWGEIKKIRGLVVPPPPLLQLNNARPSSMPNSPISSNRKFSPFVPNNSID